MHIPSPDQPPSTQPWLDDVDVLVDLLTRNPDIVLKLHGKWIAAEDKIRATTNRIIQLEAEVEK